MSSGETIKIISFIILLFQVLADSFDLTRPSLGQYLQKLKNAGAYNITRQHHAPEFLSFYKYWPDDGTVRPKLVANI